MKPVEGGKACLVRLFNAGGSPEVATFSFGGQKRSVYTSSLREERGAKVSDVRLPAYGITTLIVGE